MTHRERILSVFRGQTPDAVPFMLDLSHWFYHRNRMPWDLTQAYEQPETELIDYHRKMDVGFYLPNLAPFHSVTYPSDVKPGAVRSPDGTEITWSFETPLGTIRRTRRWEPDNYAWGIVDWGVQTEQDLRVLAYALGRRRFAPRPEVYRAWNDEVGQTGVVYVIFGYSAMGQLLNLWMGIERTMYAICDWPQTMREVVDTINANNLELIDVMATLPGEVVLMGDNFSSDIQPPHFFAEWTRSFYIEAVRRLHATGKFVGAHIDGRLRGALRMIRETGVDCSDATTPTPMGDLTPTECRAEAGGDMILSGGVPPNLWLPNVDVDVFKASVLQWLDLRRSSPRLIAAAGDQVPPGADEDRIRIMRDLVETHGRY